MDIQEIRKIGFLRTTQEIMNIRAIENFRLLFKVWSQNKTQLLQNLDQMFRDLANYQSENSNYCIKYLQCALLKSSFITESFHYLISAFSEEYYLDEFAFHFHWDASPFFKFLNEDMKYIAAKLRKTFPRVQEYELRDVRYRVCYYYDIMVGALFTTAVPDMLEMPSFKQLSKTDDFCILLSGWLDESFKLYPLDIKSSSLNSSSD